jgi:hypothetical protein
MTFPLASTHDMLWLSDQNVPMVSDLQVTPFGSVTSLVCSEGAQPAANTENATPADALSTILLMSKLNDLRRRRWSEPLSV